MESPSHAFFEAVVNRDYDMLSGLYAMNARNAIMSFLSMRSRWSTAEMKESRAGEFASMFTCVFYGRNLEVHDGGVDFVLFETLKLEVAFAAVMTMYFGGEYLAGCVFQFCLSYLCSR
jgi:hypothetical protein